ncbi:hypothetical protein XELAEV_18046727mg [Xenopus laevis]|uniref:Uncharacterized protein n=1 Tax=Xenopus laevis TaxID=8355 RepID=A0A974H176_XENLA|nr:hypothetical protein XELAEV_18046727mg [Xenopus laevis]
MVLYTGGPISHLVDPAFLFTPSLSVQKPGSAGCLAWNERECSIHLAAERCSCLCGASPYTQNMVFYTRATISHSVDPAFLFTPSLSLQKPGSVDYLGSNGMERNAEFT